MIDPTTRTTHKACAECKRLLPRETSYAVRYLDDPFAVAAAENKRRKVRNKPALAGEARLAFIQAADTSKSALFVQPRCFECDQLRSKRKAFGRAIRARFPDAGLSNHLAHRGSQRSPERR